MTTYLGIFLPSQFLEYMKPEKLAYLRRRDEEECKWVFWSEENDDKSQDLENFDGTLDHSSQISKKIKDMLEEVRFHWWSFSLIQFWAPKRIGDRCFLTTANQPFALYKLSKNCASYRKQCVEKHIYMREEGNEEEVVEEALGPIGRAFRNKLPESRPWVRFYSRQEFPLVRHASLCCSRGLAAFPVFEIESQTCVGVLEFLGFPVGNKSLDTDILSFERQLEVAGLTLNHPYLKPVPKDQPDSWNEIKEAIKVVARTHPLSLALAFIPSAGCWEKDEYCRDSSDTDLLKLAFIEEPCYNGFFYQEFINVHRAFHLQKGKGVAGKAFASLRSCFCIDIRDFRVTEYPFAHFTRDAGFKFSFAICLRTTKLKKGLLILEFFLSLDSSANPYPSLQSLLAKFKEHIQSFEILAEDVPIEELFPKVRKSSDNDEDNFFGSESGFSTTGSDVSVTHAENRARAKRQKRQAGDTPDISYEDIISALSGHEREKLWWLLSQGNKGRMHDVSSMQNTDAASQGGEGSVSVNATPSSLDWSSQENVQPIGPVIPNIVTIEVSYEGRGTISFGLRPTATVAELEGEVAKRLDPNVGSFRIAYDDEEGDPITITCDEDLQHCVEIMTSIGRTTIKMAVQLISD